LEIGQFTALLSRNISSDSVINATCINLNQQAFSIDVPLNTSTTPIYGDTIYNISDLIFYLAGIKVLKIPVSRNKEDSGLVRLSLRNFMWYCYLDQSKLDNSFFRQEDSTKSRNSKEVLKYILQYSTQKIVELEEKLQESRVERFNDTAKAKGLREFLKQFGFSTENEIETKVHDTTKKLLLSKEQKKKLESGYTSDTHNSDKVRNEIRDLISEIYVMEDGLIDLRNRINQQESLKSELISSKFKLAKSDIVATLFQGVHFDNCPDCGTNLTKRKIETDNCKLCGEEIGKSEVGLIEKTEMIQSDLDDRIKELEGSIDFHKKSLKKTQRELEFKIQKRQSFDVQLQNELSQYESVFLSNIREVDKRVATLEERIKSLNRLKMMPQEISRLEENALKLLKIENSLKQEIREARGNLVKGEKLIEDLEKTFLATLIEVGMPGISPNDVVSINRKTWDVSIWPEGEEYLKWNFYNAGSGGKKTLFNSCFLLSVHVVSALNNLPLPTFIIIDTPMKNIDKEVNQDIFRSFYNHIYNLASDILDKTQFIIVDNNFVPPPPELKLLKFYDRYMTGDDPLNPPLISYYQGS
jgi:hypothetical protein